jgi:short-subunit dehydrogenase
MKNTNKVLILGATGGIGGEIARKLIRENGMFMDCAAVLRNMKCSAELRG